MPTKFASCITLGLLLLLAHTANSQSLSADIRLNQVGFYLSAPKKAAVIGVASQPYYILNDTRTDTVYTGMLSSATVNALAGESISIADFTDVDTPGSFVVDVPGVGYSWPFSIGIDPYATVVSNTLRGFYYQRASIELVEQFAGAWHRELGHPDTSVIVHSSAEHDDRTEGFVFASPRGWYDAGDYNKYVVSTSIALSNLLSAYEDFPAYLDTLSTNIPESSNQLPDVLDEALWGIRWILTTQDPQDGGVYHKVATTKFEGFKMPAAVAAPRWAMFKSVTASLDFAAVLAQASRIFSGFESQVPGLADSCLEASVRAWQFARANPTRYYIQEQINVNYVPDTFTTAYDDSSAAEEFQWAGVELYATTLADSFYVAAAIAPVQPVEILRYDQPRALAYNTLQRMQGSLTDISAADLPGVLQETLTLADALVDGSMNTGYGTVMGQAEADFVLASNAVATNQSHALIQAYQLTGTRTYLDHALDNLDYVLGRNAMGYSFVTGVGSKNIRQPYHRISASDGVVPPVPGLMAGGPNAGQDDQCTYSSPLPAKSFVDSQCSFSSNETNIMGNASLAYASAAMEALRYSSGYAVPTAVDGPWEASHGLVLEASFPNPFAGRTQISFMLPQTQRVSVELFDVLGRRVKTMVGGTTLSVGRHTYLLDLSDQAAGQYFIRVAGDRDVATRALLKLR